MVADEAKKNEKGRGVSEKIRSRNWREGESQGILLLCCTTAVAECRGRRVRQGCLAYSAARASRRKASGCQYDCYTSMSPGFGHAPRDVLLLPSGPTFGAGGLTTYPAPETPGGNCGVLRRPEPHFGAMEVTQTEAQCYVCPAACSIGTKGCRVVGKERPGRKLGVHAEIVVGDFKSFPQLSITSSAPIFFPPLIHGSTLQRWA